MATPEGVHLVLRAFDAERKRHDQLAQAARSLLLALEPQVCPTPDYLQARARLDDLLAGHSNRREQEQRLYPWQVTA